MLFLRSLLFNAAFYLWSAVYLTLCLPVLLMPPRYSARIGRLWARVAFGLLRMICGLSHEVRGLENLPEPPFIIAAKHQSAWDTMVFSLFLKHPSFIMKRELQWIPLFGWYTARAGVIAINRKGGARELKRMIARAAEIAAQKRPIIIFPEGTRMAPGATRPYHPGVAALYTHLALPIVPVALNSGWFWGRRSFIKQPGQIVMEILPPIPPGLTRKELLPRLSETIETACAKLPKPADLPEES